MADVLNSPVISSDYILINGISSNTVGLYIDTPPVPPMAKQRYTQYQVGADTDLVSADNSFENIRLTVNAYQFYPENFDNRAVYNFLKDAQTLQTSRFDDFIYRVQKVSVNTPESYRNGSRIKYQIEFECEPFKYAAENLTEEVSAGTIINAGNRYCRPVWVVTGSGTCTLTVNMETLTITDLSGSCCVDCQKMIVYTQSAVITQHTSGKFPFLQPGENSVGWNENVSRVTVQKNERWY